MLGSACSGGMAWLVEPIPASKSSEMAHFLREKAEECLRLARAMTDESASAKELIVMAASLHERAVKLETSSVPLAGVKDSPAGR